MTETTVTSGDGKDQMEVATHEIDSLFDREDHFICDHLDAITWNNGDIELEELAAWGTRPAAALVKGIEGDGPDPDPMQQLYFTYLLKEHLNNFHRTIYRLLHEKFDADRAAEAEQAEGERHTTPEQALAAARALDNAKAKLLAEAGLTPDKLPHEYIGEQVKALSAILDQKTQSIIRPETDAEPADIDAQIDSVDHLLATVDQETEQVPA